MNDTVFRNFFEKFLPSKHPDLTDMNQITKHIIEDYKQWVVVEQGRINGWREELAKLKTMFSKLVAIGCCNRAIQTELLAQSEKVIGKKLTPHEFRHSFCTRMLRQSHAERDIMAVTGHKDIDSFKVYAHSTSEGTKQVIEQSKLF